MKKFLLTSTALALLTPVALAQVPSNGEDTSACRSARGELEPHLRPGTMSPDVLKALQQKYYIRRQQDQASCDEIKRQASERLRKYNIEVAEPAAAARALADQQAAQRRAERIKRNEEMARLAANRTPAEAAQQEAELNLGTAYAAFVFVKWCHDVREGYLSSPINANELDRAQIVVRTVAAQSTKVAATIDTDKLWRMALEINRPRMDQRKADAPGFSFVCRDALRQLYELSPTPVYSIAKP